jgi:hypothetical protein
MCGGVEGDARLQCMDYNVGKLNPVKLNNTNIAEDESEDLFLERGRGG